MLVRRRAFASTVECPKRHPVKLGAERKRKKDQTKPNTDNNKKQHQQGKQQWTASEDKVEWRKSDATPFRVGGRKTTAHQFRAVRFGPLSPDRPLNVMVSPREDIDAVNRLFRVCEYHFTGIYWPGHGFAGPVLFAEISWGPSATLNMIPINTYLL